jgi:hypothetical protein
MPCPQVFGNDEVERLAGSLLGREAEDPLRAGIPECDVAFAIGPQPLASNAAASRMSKYRSTEPD